MRVCHLHPLGLQCRVHKWYNQFNEETRGRTIVLTQSDIYLLGKGGKTMQKTFQLLRRGDIEGVRQILDKKPEEVNAVSGDKPKKRSKDSRSFKSLLNRDI